MTHPFRDVAIVGIHNTRQARELPDHDSRTIALEAALGAAKSTGLAWRPKSLTPVEGDAVATLLKLIDALEDEDDVQTVWGNYDISDADLEAFGG